LVSFRREDFGRFFDNPLKRAGRETEHDELDAAHFDEEARTFIERMGEEALIVRMDEPMPPRHRAFWDAVGDVRGKRTLDVGCGAGWCACMLALRGADSVAIDVSSGMCELARRSARLNNVRVDVRRLSAVETGFPDGCFDLVVGQVSFHHLPFPAAAVELHRILRRGGRAVFMDPIHGSRLFLSLRSRLPLRCHESPGGGAVRRDQVADLTRLFGRARISWFGPMARFDRFTVLEPAYPLLGAIDRLILRLPGSGWLTSYVVMALEKTAAP
jgi:SAM-dependent methyltransferase